MPFPVNASQAEITSIVNSVGYEELADRLETGWRANMLDVAHGQLSKFGFDEASFGLVNPAINLHLEDFGGVRIKAIHEGVQARLGATLSEGVLAGESIPQLRKRVTESMGQIPKWRATAIARTEVTRSSNIARRIAWQTTDMELSREWVATRDPPRVRASHLDLDGQIRGLEEPWTFKAFPPPDPGIVEDVMSPGDAPSPGHSVNCRCTIVAFLDDEDSPLAGRGYGKRQLDAIWRAFDRHSKKWETRGRVTLVDFYKMMESAILEKLPLPVEPT